VAAEENGYRDKVIPTWGKKCGLNADRAHGQQVEFIRRASTSTIKSHGRLRHVPELPISVQTTEDTSCKPSLLTV